MRPSLLSRFAVPACVIVGVSLATLLFEHLGMLDHFEMTGLDTFSVLQTRPVPTDVLIVTIPEEDYDNPAWFNATSPLNCGVLKTLVDAIGASRPLVIGVDLDTQDSRFDCLKTTGPRPPVVWARDAVWDAGARRFKATAEQHIPSGDATGAAVLPLDRDGVLRRYVRSVPLDTGQQAVSFPAAVVETACRAGCQTCCRASSAGDASEELRLNFSGDRFAFMTLPAGAILSTASAEGWQQGQLLAGKIVLVGGTYRAARDVQLTPVGPKAGVEIMAQAIESELHGGGIRPLNTWLAFALDVLVGLLLVYVNYRLRARVGLALVISLVIIPFLCLASSFLAFSTIAFWFNFTPVVVSVMLHQLFEHGREYQRLRAAHERLHSGDHEET